MLNARIRKRWRAGNYPIGLIGERANLTYQYDYLGQGPETLADLAAGKHAFADVLKGAQHPLIILGAGALARPDGAAIAALAAKAAQSLGAVKDGWNGFSVLQTVGVAGRRARPRLRAGERRHERRQDGGRPAASTWCSCSAPTRSRSRPAPSWSISAPMATAARIAPTSSCRAPPIRRNPASTSTPKAACRWRRARHSRPARRGRTGRSCARCRTCWATGCPMTRSRNCARRCSRRIRISSASARSRPATPADIAKLANLGGTPDKAPFASPIDDYYLTNPIARASAVMAECSVIAEGSAARTAAE